MHESCITWLICAAVWWFLITVAHITAEGMKSIIGSSPEEMSSPPGTERMAHILLSSCASVQRHSPARMITSCLSCLSGKPLRWQDAEGGSKARSALLYPFTSIKASQYTYIQHYPHWSIRCMLIKCCISSISAYTEYTTCCINTYFSVSLGCSFLQQVLSSSHSHYLEKDSSLQFIALQGNKAERDRVSERVTLYLGLKSDLNSFI